METIELRQGNLISFRGYTREVKYIMPNKIKVDGAETYYFVSEFEPILLNEEWFLKFGFEKDLDDTAFIIKLSLESTYLLINHTMNYWIEYSDAHGHIESVGMPKIKYVHQLQNLYFALTGEELTLKS